MKKQAIKESYLPGQDRAQNKRTPIIHNFVILTSTTDYTKWEIFLA